MSHFLNRLKFLTKKEESFSKGHGKVSTESRDWENSYRGRWQHDKVVRSTHGVNCTGSCSWQIYVKGGIVTWETQQTDYPRTRPDLPNHEPRGCPRGASYSWYLYSANRVKHPMGRAPLIRAWRKYRKALGPVDAWTKMMSDPKLVRSYQKQRGMGNLLRITWEEANEIVAAANVYTTKKYGPDRIIGFSPIPAMSMVSYAAGTRYLSLIGGVPLSFYDWYCDLPPSSPQVWGEQTDVSESADWYNSNYLILWGSNVPQTRTPDAHFMSEVRYKGTKVVAVTPDYAEVAKFSDLWIHPKQGTDAALAMAMGHVIIKEFHVKKKSAYFDKYCRQYTDMPNLVCLVKKDGGYVPDRYLRASDIAGGLGEKSNTEWKTLVFDEKSDKLAVPRGSVGFRWGADREAKNGKWNLKNEDSKGNPLNPLLSLAKKHDAVIETSFPYFGGVGKEEFTDKGEDVKDVIKRNIPVRKIKTKAGTVYVATVFDLNAAHYGVDQGLGGDVARSYDDENVPYTPAWQEKITGVPREQAIQIAREFAENADKTEGRSMVILGAGVNHWYHLDMNYRSIIAMLVMCGCIGKSGGGWAHYVGQEKLRPQTGWQVLAFATDWTRPPRQMNGTSFFYNHTDQWRYETMEVGDLLSPLADKEKFKGSMIDFNVRSERMGWLPSAPQLNTNPLRIAAKAKAKKVKPADYIISGLKAGKIKFACEDPDAPENFPRNMFVWRSNIMGSSSKGHEYFLKHLLGTSNGVIKSDLAKTSGQKPTEVKWRDKAPEGKLDLLVTLDFRMSTTCLYSDIVLPTATFYEKNDLNTSDMHPFIHPFSAAVNPVWEARSDWEIFKGFAKTFSELSHGHLGKEQDIVGTPIMHDTAGEIAQAYGVKDWKKGECDLIPGKTMPNFTVVERDYSQIYNKYTSVGPLLDKLGNGGKGISWNTESEVKLLEGLNRKTGGEGPTKDRPRIVSDIDATEVILSLAPETNGEVAVKAWGALSEATGIDHRHLASAREDEKIRYLDLRQQPRKIISSPTWSGIESEHVSYSACYTNVHEYIPWRTITGRQQLYQDHEWMIAFGEGFCSYKPPIDLRSLKKSKSIQSNGNKEIALNFLTPHQKWGIHSSYSENLIMQTLSRGGPIVWLSEVDAEKIGVEDNDWIEVFNDNGALTARAVVSQRVPEGMTMMYHAQEKILNIPGSEITKQRGGIHNSVTRVVLNPVHMIGGYAHLSYGFNYYGTVGCNRDEFAIVRKMNKVDWLEGPTEEGEEA